ncbi:hypothetical protein [Brachymonas sp.]|uniref:hypothetical protein n=1 Tax=Brachymonas sp. TaxID=1936292 RepID=UPI0035B3E9A6
MIGEQRTGAIDGVRIQAVAHEGLSVTVNGKPAELAIIVDGKVIAAGAAVAREAEAVAVNCHRNFLKGQGHLRVLSEPIKRAA